MSVLTNRFTVREVIGRSVIVHDSVDDFTTQPSGNSGAMIACGRILR
ncbi:MAG: superoxide dismutase family protein, partial [Clostridiales bacterium]|nr:superoxide dismutase family protein [Clostridiales bacterium]